MCKRVSIPFIHVVVIMPARTPVDHQFLGLPVVMIKHKGERDGIVIYYHMTNYLKTQQLKMTITHTVSVDQNFKRGLLRWLWLIVS